MRRARSDDMLASEKRKLKPLADAMLQSLGFTKPGRYREWARDTVAGQLNISVYDDWFACCFDDLKRCERYTGQTYSGKWNHHRWQVVGSGRCTAQQFVDYMREQLVRLLPEAVEPAPRDVRPFANSSGPEIVEQRRALRATIRQNRQAVSGSILALTVPTCYTPQGKPFPSPIKRLQTELRRPYEQARRQAEQQLAALEEVHPVKPFWQPRKSTAADKRIAKQYEERFTPRTFRFFRTRVTQDYIDKRIAKLRKIGIYKYKFCTVAEAAEMAAWEAEYEAGQAAREEIAAEQAAAA